jgi:hypothetical protein
VAVAIDLGVGARVFGLAGTVPEQAGKAKQKVNTRVKIRRIKLPGIAQGNPVAFNYNPAHTGWKRHIHLDNLTNIYLQTPLTTPKNVYTICEEMRWLILILSYCAKP